MKEISGGVTAPKGFSAAGVACGIKSSGRPDLALLKADLPCRWAGVFTQNLFAAAPVLWSRGLRKKNRPVRAVVVNSGAANACTGERGAKNARRMAELTAEAVGCGPAEVLIASTGVIGRQLPMENVEQGIRGAAGRLRPDGGPEFAGTILTTDTVSKECAVEIEVDGIPVRIGGCAKGVGMIEPNMATLIAVVTTDAAVETAALKKAFTGAVNATLNRVTVDGDTSTNDTAYILASGRAGNRPIKGGKALAFFIDALSHVCRALAQKIAADGEGATKRATVRVTGAKTEADADRAARAIANSPLVKTALFGNDPNWGRIFAAAGCSGARFDPRKASLALCGIPLARKGEPLPFDAKAVSEKLKAREVEIAVDLGAGRALAELYTCDFSYDYVKINAEYTT